MSDILKTDDKTKTNLHYEGGLSEGKIRDKNQESQAHIMDSPRPKYSTAHRGKHPRSIFLCWDLHSDFLPVRGEDERFSLKSSLMIACVTNIIVVF